MRIIGFPADVNLSSPSYASPDTRSVLVDMPIEEFQALERLQARCEECTWTLSKFLEMIQYAIQSKQAMKSAIERVVTCMVDNPTAGEFEARVTLTTENDAPGTGRSIEM